MPVAALAAAGLGGSIIGAFGANSAANKQVDAANNAANLQFQAGQNALNFEKQQYNNSLQLGQPYYETGIGALDLLRTGLGIPGAAPNNFQFPGSTPVPTRANLQGLFGGDSPIVDRLGMIRGGSGPQPFQATSAAVPNGGFGFNGQSLVGEGGTPTGANFSTQGATASTNNGGGAVQSFSPGTGPNGPNGGTAATGNPNIGFGSLLQSYPGGPFVAPDSVTEQNDPGYMFRLKTGMDLFNNGAAARGGLLSGGTLKAAEDFAQNDASNEYGNVYNRALNTYDTNYNSFVNNQTNQFNRLAAIAGLGQTSAQNLSTAGLETSNAVGSNLLGTAGAIGQDLNNAGAARASGITGMTNSLTGGLNSLGNLALLAKLLGGSGAGSAGSTAAGLGAF